MGHPAVLKTVLKSLLRFPQSYWIDLQYGEDLEVRTESKEDLTEIGEGGEDDWLTDSACVFVKLWSKTQLSRYSEIRWVCCC